MSDGIDEVLARQRARLRVRVGAVVVLVLVGLGCAVLVAALGDHGASSTVSWGGSGASGAPVLPGTVILVHVLGAVESPGLYELREGDRVVDAIAAAGGYAATADEAAQNLARVIADGEQLSVPVLGQAAVAAPGLAADGRVNLNTADEATLDTLPRVGPAMAARIIAWREANGGFTAVEDLLGVSGIGSKTLEGLRDLVTV